MLIRGITFYAFYVTISYYQSTSFDLRKSSLYQLRTDKSNAIVDLKKCRVTHSGVEYEGDIAQTKRGILCQNWATTDPLNKVIEQIVDVDFPEGSKKKAKNYCRNPQHWSGKPWCYVLEFNSTREDCDVPLCTKNECRLSGPGVEYSGTTHSSGLKDCLHWIDIRGAEYKELLYNSLFPDGTIKNALNHCRNPNSDVGGPWCFVDSGLNTIKSKNLKYEKVYCGIPHCEPKPCMTATAAVSSGYQEYHTVFSLLPPNTTSINFSVKLWRPDQWHSGELRLALAVFTVPATGGQMRSWKTGIEIIISTYKSGLTPEGSEKPDWNVEAGLLSGIHWQDLELSWTGGFISLKIKGKSSSIFTKDYTEHEKDLSKGQFQFYSIKGSNALWNLPFCSSDYAYEEHITTHGDFERRWPLPKIITGFELKFFVRGFHTAIIELKSAAMSQYPSIQLILVNLKNGNTTTLTIKESAEDERKTLEEVKIESLLSYWEWREFLLNIDGPRLELYSIKNSISENLLNSVNPKIEAVKWFSIGSRQSTVHWTISCSPPLDKFKILAELPECVMTEEEAEFTGSQSVSATGLTCIPWADSTGMIPQDLDDSRFVDGSKEFAKNFCRNPTGSINGPYCYAVDMSDSGYLIRKQYCFPRQCRSMSCRIAGTGNDYIGSLSVTVSGRTCQRWTANSPHAIPQKLINKEMFPELSLNNVSNYCRNPSHDIGGLWCYTSDPAVDVDMCNVPDCDVPGSCTILVKGNTSRLNVYVLPLWKTRGLVFKMKSWDPKWTEGLRFVIQLTNTSAYYRLDLGAGDNNKVILYYVDSGNEKILKQKTIARVVPSGHWAEFVLVLGVGEIGIKYDNLPSAAMFFYWKHTYSEDIKPFEPRFLSYSALGSSNSIGLSFLCEECHTHITNPGLVESIFPLNWWEPQNQLTNTKVLTLHIRGTGTFILVLIRMVDTALARMLIEVSDYGQIIIKDQNYVLKDVRRDDYRIFNNHSWTNFTLMFTEEKLTVAVQDITVIDLVSDNPIIFYFFSVSVSDGLLIWNANCNPPELDATPVNGGWSSWGPWQCSVTCGGGYGKRIRRCDSPKPNMFGEPCNGSTVMDGVCNDFTCGDVPPELYKIMTKHTTKKAHNIRKRVGETLTISCDKDILNELKRVSPSTNVEWTKDGVLLYSQQRVENITIDDFIVNRTKAALNDSGIYICALEDRKKRKAIIQFTAVTVVTNTPTRYARNDSTIILDCQAASIYYLFSELTQFWTLNGKLFQDYGATSYSLMDVDLLRPVSNVHTGEWECVIVQVQYNLTWVTAWFKLQVTENTVVAIMFGSLFLGQHFRPFGDNSKLNSIAALILIFAFISVIVLVVCCLLSIRMKGKTAVQVNINKSDNKNQYTLLN